MSRRFALLLALIALFVSIAGIALPTSYAQTAPPKPVIRATTGDGAVFAGVPGSFCWPDAAGALTCDVNDNPEPKAAIPVKAGDTVTFVIDPAPLKLDSFKASLIDDLDPKGDPRSIDISVNSTFTVPADLKSGAHRVQAEAIYPASATGDQAFIYYAFLLTIADGGNVAPTALASAPTVPPPGPQPIGTLPPVDPNQPTALPPAPTIDNSTPTASPTPSNTPTPVPPTATPTQTPSPTITPTPTATLDPASPNVLFPALTLKIGDKEFQPIAVDGCVFRASGVKLCVASPINAASLVEGAKGGVANYAISGVTVTDVKLSIRAADGVTPLAEGKVAPGAVIPFRLPENAGRYIFTAEISYDGGRVTYFFRANIQ